MKEFFDYLMRRKPLLLLFLAVFLASGLFSYHIFIQSQTVVDSHVSSADQPPTEEPLAAPEATPELIETLDSSEAPTEEMPVEETPVEIAEYVEAPGFFTIVQDARATALMEHPKIDVQVAEVVAEIEIPHTGELTDEEMSIGDGTNLEAEGAGEAQGSSEVAVPHTGDVESSTTKNPFSVLVTEIILLAAATIVLGLYSIIAHFLR